MIRQKDSISGWAKGNDELALVRSIEGRVQAKDFVNSDMNKLVDLLGKWRLMVGVNTEVSPQEYIVIAGFIFENYKYITLEEIDLAITLSLKGELGDVDVKTYGNFSALYVSAIINAFYVYKREHIMEILQRKGKEEREKLMETPKPSPVEQRDSMREIMFDEYNHYKEHDTIKDYGSLVYNFLLRTKRITITNEDVEAALAYGRTEAIKIVDKDSDSLVEIMKGNDVSGERRARIESLTKIHARKYCVKKLFFKINIAELVDGISETDFKQES